MCTQFIFIFIFQKSPRPNLEHDKTNKMTCTPSEDSDQPGHPPCLTRVFTVRLKDSQGPNAFSGGQRRLWSDWADAQADLNLRWAHVILLGFVMLQLIYTWLWRRLDAQVKNRIKTSCPGSELENWTSANATTVMFLNFRTDRSGQTVQT